jgi:hypothetical protein
LANEGELADRLLLKKDCSISSSFEQPAISGASQISAEAAPVIFALVGR